MKLLCVLVTMFGLSTANAADFSPLKWCRAVYGDVAITIEQKVNWVEVKLSSVSAETSFDVGDDELIGMASAIDTLDLQTVDFAKAVEAVTTTDQILRYLRISETDEIDVLTSELKQKCK